MITTHQLRDPLSLSSEFVKWEFNIYITELFERITEIDTVPALSPQESRCFSSCHSASLRSMCLTSQPVQPTNPPFPLANTSNGQILARL